MSGKSHLEMARDAITKIEQQYEARLPSPAYEVDPEPSDDPKARRATWAPDKTIVSLSQHSMYGAWNIEGAIGLALFIYEQARLAQERRERKHSTWAKIIQDAEEAKPTHMVKLILSIPPDIVTAVICGNVESRKHQDPKFEVLLDKYARLEPTPGIYLNILCRGKWGDILPGSQIPMVSPNAGKGLSLRNLKTLHERLALYMEDTSEALKYVERVDRAMPSAKPQSFWRVYLKPDRDHEEKVKEFMNFLEQEYLSILDEVDDPLDPIFDAPMDRCFSEIGWSKNTAHRATDHLTHDGTTALFGLVHAIMRVEWGSDFTIAQYQLVRVWDRDDAALAEATMSVIASSYWYDGGMNMFFAGGGIQKGDLENEDMKQPFRANHVAVFLSGLMENNLRLDEEKTARTKKIYARKMRALEVEKERDMLHELYKEAKKEWLEAAAKKDEEDGEWAITEVKDLVARYAQDVIQAREAPVGPGDFDVDDDGAAPVLNPQGQS